MGDVGAKFETHVPDLGAREYFNLLILDQLSRKLILIEHNVPCVLLICRLQARVVLDYKPLLLYGSMALLFWYIITTLFHYLVCTIRNIVFRCFVWCPCMAIDVSVQYHGGFSPGIILLTQFYYHRGARLNAIKRFCLCSR